MIKEAANSFIPYLYEIEGLSFDHKNRILVRIYFIFKFRKNPMSWYVLSTSFLMSFLSSSSSKNPEMGAYVLGAKGLKVYFLVSAFTGYLLNSSKFFW